MSEQQSAIVRTRVAPSPTGDLHIGTLSIVLKNYAFAKRHGGQFILRIEDTDKTREVAGGVQSIQAAIKAYGLSWDEGPDSGGPVGPYIQSQRLDLYQKYAQQLVQDGHAYYCFCSRERLEKVKSKLQAAHLPPKYDGHCRNLSIEESERRIAQGEANVIRLKVPTGQTATFTDWIRGQIEFATDTVDDQVLLKSDGYPTYHLGVVVDDHLMNITHVMRGEEWISSTPKHILLYQAFGWELPIFAHIPIYLNPDGKGKMSKRSGTVSAQSFLDKGFLPEAILNFLMILGWTPHDQREILTLDEYIQEFDPRDLSKKSVVFDVKKLTWMNGQYIRSLSQDELFHRLAPFLPSNLNQEKIRQVIPLVQERLETLGDFFPSVEFFFEPIHSSQDMLLAKINPDFAQLALATSIEQLSILSQWSNDSIQDTLRSVLDTNNWSTKDFFMLLRRAVTGRDISPPLFETLWVIGQAESIQRLSTAKEVIQEKT